MRWLSATLTVCGLAALSSAAALEEHCAADVLLLQTAVAVSQTAAPVTVTTTVTSTTKPANVAAEAVGIAQNGYGDREVYLTSLMTYTPAALVIILLFSVVRRRFPLVFQSRLEKGDVPMEVKDGLFAWIPASLSVTVDIAKDVSSLDVALMLHFFSMGSKMMFVMGFFMTVVMMPQFALFGGGEARISNDILNLISFGNIVPQTDNYLFYETAFVVVGVTAFITHVIYEEQQYFLSLRFEWLRGLGVPRASSVLVEGIPEGYRCEEKLAEFFEAVTGKGSVAAVAVVKHADKLQNLATKLETTRQQLERAQALWEAEEEKHPDRRPSHSPSVLSFRKVDSIQHFTEQIERLEKEVELEKKVVQESAKSPGGINVGTAFVTFHRKKDTEIARTLIYSNDKAEWVVAVPPEPSDIRWEDFKEDQRLAIPNRTMGYAFLLLLFAFFIPSVVAITNVANGIQFGIGLMNYVWQSLAPTLGLTIFMMLLPTLMRLIFSSFFILKAETWSQRMLQDWSFGFQVVFVILVTSIEGDIFKTAEEIAKEPFSIFSILGANMPKATHFYLNYLVLQWVTDCTPLLRLVPWIKFLSLQPLYGDEAAKAMIEPEDQDTYGMGGRTLKYSIHLAIGIVFGTLSPMLGLLTAIDLFLARLVHGWICIFAETKKPDLGGPFWVAQLHHIFVALVIYNLMMAGVLFVRCTENLPSIVAIGALLWTVVSWRRFTEAFQWELLPFKEVSKEPDEEFSTLATYIQPELKSVKELAQIALGRKGSKV